jgi:hypothetical protein
MRTACSEQEMRRALGLAPSAARPSVVKPSRLKVRMSYRPVSGGSTKVYEHTANTVSRFEAQLDADRIVRSMGGVQAVLLSIDEV